MRGQSKGRERPCCLFRTVEPFFIFGVDKNDIYWAIKEQKRRDLVRPTPSSNSFVASGLRPRVDPLLTLWPKLNRVMAGNTRSGTNMLTLADCGRRIQLEFFLGNARDRRQSLAKVGLLIDVLDGFRTALEEEAKLIEQAR